MRFGTDGIRGRAGTEVTVELARNVGNAVARVVGPHVWLARDPRASSPALLDAAAEGVVSGGGFASLLGVLPTPGLSARVRDEKGSAAIMITASHNPAEDNGLKVLFGDGRKLSTGVLAALSEEIDAPKEKKGGARREVANGNERYLAFVLGCLPAGQWLEGRRILLDAALGAGLASSRRALEALGATVDLYAGRGINDRCGAVHPQFAASQVQKRGCEAALVLDGDGDRVAMVDANGRVLDGDALLWILRRGPAMVGTVMTNLGLERALAREGIVLHRTNVGDTHVAHAMAELRAEVGGEPSGHLLLADGCPSADGLLAGLRAMAASPTLSTEGYLPCAQAHAALRDVLRVEVDTTFVVEAGGRCVVRRSGTEPVVRVMVEHDDVTLANTLRDRVCELLREAS